MLMTIFEVMVDEKRVDEGRAASLIDYNYDSLRHETSKNESALVDKARQQGVTTFKAI